MNITCIANTYVYCIYELVRYYTVRVTRYLYTGPVGWWLVEGSWVARG